MDTLGKEGLYVVSGNTLSVNEIGYFQYQICEENKYKNATIPLRLLLSFVVQHGCPLLHLVSSFLWERIFSTNSSFDQ